jgi:ABC-type lipopolysaccharide export system ATPase subunit
LGLGYLAQEASIFRDLTVENILGVMGVKTKMKEGRTQKQN